MIDLDVQHLKTVQHVHSVYNWVRIKEQPSEGSSGKDTMESCMTMAFETSQWG